MRAKNLVTRLLEAPDQAVVKVFEDGTADPFTALYINGKLTVTNPRSDVDTVLAALGIIPREVFIPRGFSGDFPPKLNQLKYYAHPNPI